MNLVGTTIKADAGYILSYIIPLYNCGKYIRRCLQSIQRQHVSGGYEIIVVDDGSTDDGYAIVQSIQDEDDRIKLIRQDNAGVGMARNTALEIAQGKYVYFVDADDILIPDSIPSQLEMMELHNLDAINMQADVVKDGDNQLLAYMGAQITNGTNNITERTETSDSKRIKILGSGIEYLKSTNLVRTDCANVWRYIYRRDVLERHNLRFVHFAAEDHVFNVNFFMYAHNVGESNDKVYVWVQYPNSASHIHKSYEDCYQMGKEWLEQHDIWHEKFYNRLESHGMLELAKANRTRITFDCMIWPMIREVVTPAKAIKIIRKLKSTGLYPLDAPQDYWGINYKDRNKILDILWRISCSYPLLIALIFINWIGRSGLKLHSSRRSERI
jgi:glycosyltransferase involved in cell wall biosynthesis